jgi:hypothetical protein
LLQKCSFLFIALFALLTISTSAIPLVISLKLVKEARLIIGNRVTAKATHITSDAECSRRYGAEMDKKWLIEEEVEEDFC